MVNLVFHSDLVVAIEQLLVCLAEIMRRNMEITRYFMDLNFALHLATFFPFETLNRLEVNALLVCLVIRLLFQCVIEMKDFPVLVENALLHEASNVDGVHACNVYYVKTQDAAGRCREGDVQIEAELSFDKCKDLG